MVLVYATLAGHNIRLCHINLKSDYVGQSYGLDTKMFLLWPIHKVHVRKMIAHDNLSCHDNQF